MKYSARVLYAAVRAEVLAYRPQLERAVLEAIRLAQRNARRIHYAKQPFDESKHPRAPAGRPEGGEFVRAGGATAPSAPAKQKEILRKAPSSWPPTRRAAFDELPTRSTAELQTSLKAHSDFLLDRFPADLREFHRIWVDRIQELLAERDYSDQNAPLAAKERIWAAQKKYLTLAVERVRLEKWLATAKRSYVTRDLVRNIREVRDALHHIKTQMEKLALITGARLPQPNPIRDWSFEQKFSRAAEIALQSGKLAPEVAEELRAAIHPANLARMAAMMAALAAAHAYPVAGLAADAVLLTYVGTDGALTGHRLYLEISSIQNEADLNAAADVLRKELASQASGKLIDLLTWGTGKGVGAFNKRYKVTIDHDQVRRLSTGEMPLIPNPKNLPIKVERRVLAKTPSHGSRPGFNEHWDPPEHWNGPRNHGEWTGPGPRGNTSWIDDRTEVKRIVGTDPITGRANPIDFYKGEVDFSKWKQGEFTVRGLVGEHSVDQPKIRREFARQKGWFKKDGVTPDEDRVLDFLRHADDGFGGKGLRLHHAGGDTVQLIPKDLHKVQHTSMAYPPGSKK
jgi:hypothetical protein